MSLIQKEMKKNPYVGPRAFCKQEVLYGRDREIADVLDLLIAERILLLHSPSGSGKTSLLVAGVLPALEKEGFFVTPVIRLDRGSSTDIRDVQEIGANKFLASAVSSLCEIEESSVVKFSGSSGEFASVVRQMEEAVSEKNSTVLVFDQFEDILTIDSGEQRPKEAFFVVVSELLRDNSRKRWAIFSMREDYLPALDSYARIMPTRLQTRYRLDLLAPGPAKQAAVEPAKASGVRFPDAIAEKLIDNLRTMGSSGSRGSVLGPYVEPVQLQVVCHRLWEKYAEVGEIGDLQTDSIGDVDSALSCFYQEKVAEVARESSKHGVSERAIRSWFEGLVTREGFRRQVLKGSNMSKEFEVYALPVLIETYLIRAESRRGATWFELAHDRLIRPITSNNGEWFENNLTTLQRHAELWEDEHNPSTLLLTGELLEEAERWLLDNPGKLSETETKYLEASRQLNERELERKREEQRRIQQSRTIRRLAYGMSALFVVSTALGITAYVNLRTAEQNAQQAHEERKEAEKHLGTALTLYGQERKTRIQMEEKKMRQTHDPSAIATGTKSQNTPIVKK